MQRINCHEIKDLEKRLVCLEDQYKDLTGQLEQERERSMISDEQGDYYHIMQRRVFVLKQIDKIRTQIRQNHKRSMIEANNSQVNIGSRVSLQNHTHSLEIQLVFDNEASPTKGFISVSSPIGKAIVGRKNGETVMVELPKGAIEYTITEIY